MLHNDEKGYVISKTTGTEEYSIILNDFPTVGKITVNRYSSGTNEKQIYSLIKKLYKYSRNVQSSDISDSEKNYWQDDILEDLKPLVKKAYIDETSFTDKEMAASAIEDLMNFFSEFEFTLNFRFTDTLIQLLKKGGKAVAKNFVLSYFELTDSVYLNNIREKMKSAEFEQILDKFAKTTPKNPINKRFKLYYGPQGTGKTTEALKETSDCIVCNSSILPSDLLQDFDFDNGKATFKSSGMRKAMENGTTIVLDEINLLPFESLRFLQGVLDGKEQITFNGEEIHIKDGFQIIGTMNLVVNGVTYALPEPLVDRAYELKKFELDPNTMANILFA